MLFNSIEFAVFLPIVFALYWGVFRGSVKVQNAFVVLASYIFYGWWDWRFVSLLVLSSAFSYVVGIGLGKFANPSARKLLLATTILVDVGFLAFFKYFNFFAESFAGAFTFFGYDFDVITLQLVIPLGISFYTFQSLGYSMDVYRRRIEPTRDILAFFAFISFFPQLIAGPIERAKRILPQFRNKRVFDPAKATDGLRQILWGLFKKMVVADNCAYFVDNIFSSGNHSGSTYLLGAFLFAFQIYGDFSGYSDIAIGTGKLFGFDLMRNFNYPFFAKSIPDFWRRWHISLSTWFRDYVYASLGGRSPWKIIRNTFITFFLIGLWHGANWTFVLWGVLNAAFLIPSILKRYGSRRSQKGGDAFSGNVVIGRIKNTALYLVSLGLIILSLVLFRAENLSQALTIYGHIFSFSLFMVPIKISKYVVVFVAILLVGEWLQRHRAHVLDLDGGKVPWLWRYAIYYGLGGLILLFSGHGREFAYFHF